MYSKHIGVILTCLAVCVLSRPSDAPEKQQPTVIPIVSQSDELEPNGTYKFSYETGNGIKREEIAYDKVLPSSRSASKNHDSSNEGGEEDEDSNEIHVQIGSYSYTAPDGTVITVRYIADENGFQPIGDHIPRVPVATSPSNSAEKSGRSLKHDNEKVDLTPVNAKSSEKSDQAKAVAAPVSTIPPSDVKTPLPVNVKSTTEVDDDKTANVDVSTAAASTAAPDQLSTETEQASTASAEQASTSAPEQTVSSEDSENLSSTSAPDQSSSTEALGQSTTSGSIDETTSEEAEQQSTTSQPTTAEESSSTTVSA